MNEREANAACVVLEEMLERANEYVGALRSIDPFHPTPALQALTALKKVHQRWVTLTSDDYPDAFEPQELLEHLAAFEEGRKEYARSLRKLQGEMAKLSALVAAALDALEAGGEKKTLSCVRSAEKVLMKWIGESNPIDEGSIEIFEALSEEFRGDLELVIADLESEIRDWKELEVEYETEGELTENRRTRRR